MKENTTLKEFQKEVYDYLRNSPFDMPQVVLQGNGLIPFFILQNYKKDPLFRGTNNERIVEKERGSFGAFDDNYSLENVLTGPIFEIHKDYEHLCCTGYLFLDPKQKNILLFDGYPNFAGSVGEGHGKTQLFLKEGFTEEGLSLIEKTIIKYMRENLSEYAFDILDWGIWAKHGFNMWSKKHPGRHFDTNNFYMWGYNIVYGSEKLEPNIPNQIREEEKDKSHQRIKSEIHDKIKEIIPNIGLYVKRINPKDGKIEETERKLTLDLYKSIVGVSNKSNITTQGIFEKIVLELGKQYNLQNPYEFC